MSAITDAATRWAARMADDAAKLAADQSSAAYWRSRSRAHWPTLRPKIVAAINAVAAEVNSATVGTEGTSNFGRFSLTTFFGRSDQDGLLEEIQLVLKCSNPVHGRVILIVAMDNYKVQMGLSGASYVQTLDYADLLEAGADAAVRRAVIHAMS